MTTRLISIKSFQKDLRAKHRDRSYEEQKSKLLTHL